jgi:hypothetical protein
MKTETFEQYLRRMHYLSYTGHKGGDLEDAYEEWLTDLQVDDLISYADAYGRYVIDDLAERAIPPMKGPEKPPNRGTLEDLIKLANSNGFNRCRRLVRSEFLKFRGI